MRREELALVILGELDESFIDEAMPKKAAFSAGNDTAGVQRLEMIKEVAEVSKRDIRIYWITRALGMAAVVALIVGAVVLLAQNWDKIAVREPDRPGVITTISEPVVTSVDNEHGALYVHADERRSFDDFDVHVTGYEFDRLWCKLYIDVTYKGVEPFTFNIKIEGNEERAQTASRFDKVSEDGDTVSYSVEVFDLKSAKYDTNIIFTKWDGTESFKIPVYFSGKLPTGDIEVNRDMYTYNNKKVTLETIWVCPYMFGFKYKASSIDDIDDLENDFRVILNSGEELKPFVRRSVDDGNGGVFVQALIGDVYADPDIRVNDRIVYFDNIAYFYVNGGIVYSKYSADPFGQITDTSMPEPGISSMYSTWLDFSSPWKQRVSHILLPLETEQRERGYEWEKSKDRIPTPYNLYNSMSLVSFCHDLNIPWENIEDNVRAWDGSVRYPPGTPPEEYEDIERFTEDELSAMRNGDTEEIAKQFASEYSVIIGENVFSPKWLYYHTAEDYKAAGITRQMIGKMLKKYEGLGLTDEAWKAFRQKLVLYYTYGAFDESSVDKTYIIDTENCKLSGERAFELLENVYYGEWEIKEPFKPYKSVLSLTYQQDPFANGMIPVTGMFETDEIYALAFTNGGAAGCLLIEKSAPDVMYWTDILPSGVGLDVVKFGYGLPGTYINRKPAVPEIKSGELSSLGLKKLFHIYGSDFEEYYRAVIDRDGYQSISEDENLYIGNGHILDDFRQYLVDMSENSVVLALPYVHDTQTAHQTPVYHELTFTKKENGVWSVEYRKADIKVYSPI